MKSKIQDKKEDKKNLNEEQAKKSTKENVKSEKKEQPKEEKSNKIIICEECKQEIPEGAEHCPNCGFKIKKDNRKKSKEKSEKKKKNFTGTIKKIFTKRNIIIIVVLIIALIAVKLLVLPTITYNNGKSSFEKGDYEKAIKYYEKIPNYKDSSDILSKAYFEYGKELINKEEFSKALDMLKKTNSKDSKNYISYAEALLDIEKGNYDNGIKALTSLQDFEKSKENLHKAYYLKADKLLSEEKYDNAKENFTKAEDYSDAKDKINICDLLVAEKKYAEGSLAEAKKLYESLPKDLVYKDVKVSDRLDTLNKYKDFVNLAGTWKGTNGYFEVRHIWKYDGSWDSWYNSYTSEAPIKCVINSDGSVKITGTATFYSFTNYSTLNSAVKGKSVSVPISITVKAGESIPKKLVSDYPALVASSGATGKVNIEYSGGKINLSFLLNDQDYSQNFSNKYTSTITFDSKK